MRRWRSDVSPLAQVGVAVLLSAVFASERAPAAMKAQRLSAPGLGASDVVNFTVSPDSEWIVYLHDPVTDGALELYAVRRTGGPPVRLSAPLPAGVEVGFFFISPDSRRVVYRAAQESAGVEELWSVPIEGPGAASVKLNPTPVTGGDVFIYAISPDSSRVVMMADLQTDARYELWSVPIAGPAGAAVKISPPISAGSGVGIPRISPDSSRVVFNADLNGTFVYELWSAPIDGPQGAALRISPAPVTEGDVDGNLTRFSPDGSRVVFLGDLVTDNVSELWSVPVAGPATAAVRLNPTPTPGGGISTNSDTFVAISPDGQTVVYYGDLATNEQFELWSSPILGPAAAAVKLNLLLCPSCDVVAAFGVIAFRIAPDGSRVVFIADRTTPGSQELWSVPIGGPAVAGTRVSPDYAGFTEISQRGYSFSDDGTRVQFQGVFSAANFHDLWSAEAGGPEGNAVALADSAAVDDLPGYSPLFSPDGATVLFDGDLVGTDENWLWSRPSDGSGSRVALTPFAVAGSNNVSQFAFLSDGSAIYRADGELDERFELFRVPITGGTSVKVSAALPPAGDVDFLVLTPDLHGAIYFADGTIDGATELWITDSLIFAADFDEEANSSEWSSTVP